jgi:hypothetical protein
VPPFAGATVAASAVAASAGGAVGVDVAAATTRLSIAARAAAAPSIDRTCAAEEVVGSVLEPDAGSDAG